MNTHARQGKVPSGWDTGPGDHQRKHGRYSNTGVGWNTTSKNDPSDKRIRPSRVKNNASFDKAMAIMPDKRNKRSVWEILPQPFPEAHFATFPEELPYNCILAGCPEGGNILDPFMGAGTTGLVARKLQRNYVGFELNPEYISIAERRLLNQLGMEEYATQQVQELKEERNSAISDRAEVMDLLDECRLQLEYLDNRFPTGTTANILNRLEIFLDKKQQP